MAQLAAVNLVKMDGPCLDHNRGASWPRGFNWNPAIIGRADVDFHLHVGIRDHLVDPGDNSMLLQELQAAGAPVAQYRCDDKTHVDYVWGDATPIFASVAAAL